MEVSQRTKADAIWDSVSFDKVNQLRLELIYYSCKIPPCLDYYTCQLPLNFSLAQTHNGSIRDAGAISDPSISNEAERSFISPQMPPYFISKFQLKLF